MLRNRLRLDNLYGVLIVMVLCRQCPVLLVPRMLWCRVVVTYMILLSRRLAMKVCYRPGRLRLLRGAIMSVVVPQMLLRQKNSWITPRLLVSVVRVNSRVWCEEGVRVVENSVTVNPTVDLTSKIVGNDKVPLRTW